MSKSKSVTYSYSTSHHCQDHLYDHFSRLSFERLWASNEPRWSLPRCHLGPNSITSIAQLVVDLLNNKSTAQATFSDVWP